MTQSKNIIQPVGMWATPDSMKSLEEQVTAMNSVEAVHAMMLTWNYLAAQVNGEANDDTDLRSGNDHSGT